MHTSLIALSKSTHNDSGQLNEYLGSSWLLHGAVFVEVGPAFSTFGLVTSLWPT